MQAGQNKVFLPLLDRPVWIWSAEAFLQAAPAGVKTQLYLVGRSEDWQMPQNQAHLTRLVDQDAQLWPTPLPGGETRQASVAKALAWLDLNDKTRPDLVAIHDAARPGLSPKWLNRYWEAVLAQPTIGHFPALPVVDTLRRYQPEGSLESVDRKDLIRVLTPQVFPFEPLLALHQSAQASGRIYTDDAELFVQAQLPLVVHEGQERLMKLTYPQDLERLSAWLQLAPEG